MLEKVTLVSSEDLAHRFGYKSPNAAFHAFCKKLNISPVPGRKAMFDPMLIRRRLDEAQNLFASNEGLSHVQRRRIRNGT